MTMDKPLFFVIFPEDGVWVAHGLQHNIVTHGESLHEVRENIDLLLKGYSEQAPRAIQQTPQADAYYWELFTHAVKNKRNIDEICDGTNNSVEEHSYALELTPA